MVEIKPNDRHRVVHFADMYPLENDLDKLKKRIVELQTQLADMEARCSNCVSRKERSKE